MQNQQIPQVLAQPFCAQGDKNTIPNAATGSNLASLQEGFPAITGLPISQGGIPPERQDFNGAMNLNSQFYFAFQNGWLPTFSQDVSDAIGGYPQGAVLWYQSSDGLQILQSAIPNNTNNFITSPSVVIGTSWTVVGATLASIPNYFYTQIANCVTKIPQNINLQLSNGTLTLKSGSTVYRGNGQAINIAQDISMTYTSNATILVCANVSGTALQGRPIANCSAGTSDPQTPNTIYYDTANNVINFYTSGGAQSEVSFPIAICTATGQISSIDQIFNGFGYIGNTMFALPGVSGLIPNGRNSDGTLNNTAVTISALRTLSFSTQTQSDFGLTATAIFSSANAVYNAVDNKNYNTTTGNFLGFVNCGTVETDSTGSITSLTPKTAFNALDYNYFEEVLSGMDYVVDSYTDASGNWYRVYKSGWLEQGGFYASSANSEIKSFLKPFSAISSIGAWGSAISASFQNGSVCLYNITNTGFTKQYVGAVLEGWSWYACGQGA